MPHACGCKAHVATVPPWARLRFADALCRTANANVRTSRACCLLPAASRMYWRRDNCVTPVLHAQEELKKLSLHTAFGPSSFAHEPAPLVPASPGEEEGKDQGAQEQIAALRRRLRSSEQTVEQLRAEMAALRAAKDESEQELRQSRAETDQLRVELEAANARPALTDDGVDGSKAAGIDAGLAEKERLQDYVSELEQERIVLSGMYRSASKRCVQLEQRLAARAQAALLRAMDGGTPALPPVVPEDDASVAPGEAHGDADEDAERLADCDTRLLWDAPEDHGDDRWCRGDWGENGGSSPTGAELSFSLLPLEQCRQLVSSSDSKLRVEDWVIRHACQASGKQGAYRHQPELEGGDDDSSSSSACGALLTISSTSDVRRHATEPAHCPAAPTAPCPPPAHRRCKPSAADEISHLTGYGGRAAAGARGARGSSVMSGGVTRAAWKTGSFARAENSQLIDMFTSSLGGSVASPPKSGGALASQWIVNFAM